jgi:hypothetical protein
MKRLLAILRRMLRVEIVVGLVITLAVLIVLAIQAR